MKQLDIVRITKCTRHPEYVGFQGKLYKSIKSFHANAGVLSMIDIFMINDDEPCIGIIGDGVSFLWTKHSDFDVQISLV